MGTKINNPGRSASLQLKTDTNGANYMLKPNGKKHYYLTVAITANTTLTADTAPSAAAGDTAETSHATGLNSQFRADATKWQFMTNA